MRSCSSPRIGLVASLGECRRDDGGPRLPPTIQALLAARLERLGPGERAVLDRAAVLGMDFSLPAIAELLPEQARAPLARHLQALVAKGLVQPRRSGTGAEDFRFRHILVQQAAYRAVPKSLRADLHERFTHWLERAAGQRAPDLDEILGYHLEQAYRYRIELGRVGPRERALAARAARLLATAARGALTRGDLPAQFTDTEPAIACGVIIVEKEPGGLESLSWVQQVEIRKGEEDQGRRPIEFPPREPVASPEGGQLPDGRAVSSSLTILKESNPQSGDMLTWRREVSIRPVELAKVLERS